MLDFEECWAAIVSRDAGADGRFFYGVRTTGVYCRPGCASRRPLRVNTLFFATSAEAKAAGLRPCKRCRPGDDSSASRHVAAVVGPEGLTDDPLILVAHLYIPHDGGSPAGAVGQAPITMAQNARNGKAGRVPPK